MLISLFLLSGVCVCAMLIEVKSGKGGGEFVIVMPELFVDFSGWHCSIFCKTV